MNAALSSDSQWDREIAELLNDISTVQQELLELLSWKQKYLATGNGEGLSVIAGQEKDLIERMQGCQDKRRSLLEKAGAEGLPSRNLRTLAESLPLASRRQLNPPLRKTMAQSRLLQHHSLMNWVLIQRTLLHLSQLIEIIATGGRSKPTYGKDHVDSAGGAFVDQAA